MNCYFWCPYKTMLKKIVWSLSLCMELCSHKHWQIIEEKIWRLTNSKRQLWMVYLQDIIFLHFSCLPCNLSCNICLVLSCYPLPLLYVSYLFILSMESHQQTYQLFAILLSVEIWWLSIVFCVSPMCIIIIRIIISKYLSSVLYNTLDNNIDIGNIQC